MSQAETNQEPRDEGAAGLGLRGALLLLLAWLVPGSGHLALKRRRRGLVFLVIVGTAIAIGVSLDGNLYRIVADRPLSILGTLSCLGMGAPYFVLRFVFSYSGEVVSAGYEYGTAFLLTAGLMNLLLVLDVSDILRGQRR